MARTPANAQKSVVVEQQSDNTKKLESIKMAMDQIEKQYGRGSIMRFGEAAQKFDISVISTGCLPLDLALGAGGLPRGRIIEIYGPEASGKTTLAMHAIAQAQLNGGICAYIDAEHALDTTYASNLGINIKNLIISQPDYGSSDSRCPVPHYGVRG